MIRHAEPFDKSGKKIAKIADKPRFFKTFPATRAPETCFHNQCAHWWRKQILRSVSRPEIPQNFRLTQISLRARKTRSGFRAHEIHRFATKAVETAA